MNTRNFPIDVSRALELHAKGLSWGLVGKIIAVEIGRPVPFSDQTVINNVRRAREAEAARAIRIERQKSKSS